PDRRGDELPEELRTKEGRVKRLKEARARLEEEECRAKQQQENKIEARQAEETASGRKKPGRKPKSPEEAVDSEAKANLTDPDSSILKTRKGWLQGYNGQAMADCETQVIVAQGLTQSENDVNQLAPMLDACQSQAGERPGEVLGDAGYWSEANARLQDETTELFIATTKDFQAAQSPIPMPFQNCADVSEEEDSALLANLHHPAGSVAPCTHGLRLRRARAVQAPTGVWGPRPGAGVLGAEPHIC
ncbi:MAG: transposase, partial [Gemmatimonadota bacterium]